MAVVHMPSLACDISVARSSTDHRQVNRLTRELSILRAAHNASVVSNTSSTSNATSSHDPIVESSLLSGSGFSIPTARRHHRTSSSTSQTFPSFVSSYDARARPSHPASLSRQNSSASRRSQTGSPAPASSIDPSNYFHQQRVPAAASNSIMMSSVVATPGSSVLGDQMSPGLMPATLRYEETAFYRQELDNAKKENEALKRRIRELKESSVRGDRATQAAIEVIAQALQLAQAWPRVVALVLRALERASTLMAEIVSALCKARRAWLEA